jgi:hypothetical protein
MVFLVLLCLSVWDARHPPSGYPSPDEFARRVRQAIQLDYQLQKDFTYLEHRRDVKISKLGKVTIGPLRTFEVYPSALSGATYKRLIRIEGKPLPPNELARRDAEHQQDLRDAAGRAERETPKQRAARLARQADEQRQRDAILADAVAVFSPTPVGRETLDGRPVLVAELKPRPDARVATREGRWMKHFEGRLWVAEADYQVVKIDMHASSDVTIAWGVVGRLHTGSRMVVARRRFENSWLPAETTYQASGRTLLFRPFQFAVTTTFSDYQRR